MGKPERDYAVKAARAALERYGEFYSNKEMPSRIQDLIAALGHLCEEEKGVIFTDTLKAAVDQWSIESHPGIDLDAPVMGVPQPATWETLLCRPEKKG